MLYNFPSINQLETLSVSTQNVEEFRVQNSKNVNQHVNVTRKSVYLLVNSPRAGRETERERENIDRGKMEIPKRDRVQKSPTSICDRRTAFV
jgi:hypothetical protein